MADRKTEIENKKKRIEELRRLKQEKEKLKSTSDQGKVSGAKDVENQKYLRLISSTDRQCIEPTCFSHIVLLQKTMLFE